MFVIQYFFWIIAFFAFEALFLFVAAALSEVNENTLTKGFQIAAANFLIAVITGLILNNLIISAAIYVLTRIYFIKEIYSLSWDKAFTLWIYSIAIMGFGVFLAVI
ncbi:MAG: hypothetical protein JW703_00595 [Candidatus Diapherotrites archaeon]|nr:hypothetical protein [Candidatus Diapherotrites archaeon]